MLQDNAKWKVNLELSQCSPWSGSRAAAPLILTLSTRSRLATAHTLRFTPVNEPRHMLNGRLGGPQYMLNWRLGGPQYMLKGRLGGPQNMLNGRLGGPQNRSGRFGGDNSKTCFKTNGLVWECEWIHLTLSIVHRLFRRCWCTVPSGAMKQGETSTAWVTVSFSE